MVSALLEIVNNHPVSDKINIYFFKDTDRFMSDLFTSESKKIMVAIEI